MQHSGLEDQIVTRVIDLPELSAVIESFDEFKDVLNTWCFSEQCYPLFVKCLWLLEYVFFLREEKQVTLRWNLLALANVLVTKHSVSDILNSSICEWRIVATAFMISSTLGFSRVEPMKIELIVDDFLSSIVI